MHYYKAFGFIIASEIMLPQLNDIPLFRECNSSVDLKVSVRDLSAIRSGHSTVGEKAQVLLRDESYICYDVPDIGRFAVSQGRDIFVHPCENVSQITLSLYIMGRCIGCFLSQRGIIALHGSCVCKGGKAIVICGYSGSGKSTLAAEFLHHGWQFMSDDITVLQKDNDSFVAVSSFPSQKLWKDSIDYYEYDLEKISSLMQERRQNKFYVDISDSFFDGISPIYAIINLYRNDAGPSITECFGLDKVRRILKNTYLNRSLYDEQTNQKAIQMSVELAEHVRLFYAVRNSRRECSQQLFTTIIELLGMEELHETQQ